jgi:hygromycin-B 4-O-kinase
MSETGRKLPTIDEINEFLLSRYPRTSDLIALPAGGWSSAFSFRTDQRELILRLGVYMADFEKEQVAATWKVPDLAIPEVLELGQAFDGFYIVSQRHYGSPLANLEAARVRPAITSLFDVLVTMSAVKLPGTGFGIWLAPDCHAPSKTWSEYLCGVEHRDESRLVDWRTNLAQHQGAQKAFRMGCDVLRSNAHEFPNTRGLVHADLLLNVLVDNQNTISAVFDWGNALAGDPLYDVAWILFCIPWFPTIERDHVLELARRHFRSTNLDKLLRLYMLHIAVGSLQYLAFKNDATEIAHAAVRIDEQL